MIYISKQQRKVSDRQAGVRQEGRSIWLLSLFISLVAGLVHAEPSLSPSTDGGAVDAEKVAADVKDKAAEEAGETDEEVERLATEDRDLSEPTPLLDRTTVKPDALPKKKVVGKGVRSKSTKGKRAASPKRRLIGSKSKRAKRKARRRFPKKRPKRDLILPPALGRIPFPPGEQLTFKVSMLSAHAGTVTLKVGKRGKLRGVPVVELSGFVQSSPFLENFYPIRDSLRVFVEEREFLPLRSEFYLNERSRKIEYLSDFNLETGAVKWEKSREVKGKKRTSKLVYDGPKKLHQTLSSLYALRRLPLEVGLTFEQFIWDGQRERLIKVKVVGEESVLCGIGKVDAYRLEISGYVTGGIISRRTLKKPPVKGTAWIAKDAFRTPIKAITPTKLGTAEALLSARSVLP